jgi:hypothetical protein
LAGGYVRQRTKRHYSQGASDGRPVRRPRVARNSHRAILPSAALFRVCDSPLEAWKKGAARRPLPHHRAESIFTEGDTWDELRKNVLEATSAFFFDRPRPERVRLHLVRDEVLLVA